MTNPAVQIRALLVRRGNREVLHGVDLDVPTGQVVGLLGPSGGGKSTLMRAIMGVQRVHGGQVTVLGRPAGDKSLRHEVGYTTQAPSVYDDLSVAENLGYFARLLGVTDVHAEVARVLELVDLSDHAHDLTGNLSGGQHSRVSLGCSLVGNPKLLVLDEPTVGLDPVLRRSLWNLFHRLADAETTIFVSSHVMEEAARCDRLVLLREGAVLADETYPGLLQQTGTSDAEAAFLALIDRENSSPATPSQEVAQ